MSFFVNNAYAQSTPSAPGSAAAAPATTTATVGTAAAADSAGGPPPQPGTLGMLLPRRVSEAIARAMKADMVLAGADASARRGYELRAASCRHAARAAGQQAHHPQTPAAPSVAPRLTTLDCTWWCASEAYVGALDECCAQQPGTRIRQEATGSAGRRCEPRHRTLNPRAP